jgi:signal transduction histidine kinase/DNA-binding response OmpR family regulator
MDDKIKVLLIEDNPGDARLLQEMLVGARGTFELKHAKRLSTGLEQLAAGEPDVILLDFSLPDSLGFDTLVKIHAQAPSVPIIVLSGLDDEALMVQAVRAGAQDYLVKGQVAEGRSDLLVRAMRYAIERKQAEMRQARYLQMEQVLRQISSRFVDSKDLDQAINGMLKDTGTVLNVSRAYLFRMDGQGATMDNTHEWVAEGSPSQIENRQGLEMASFPWWRDNLYRNEIIAISDVNQLPAPEREFLKEHNVLSILAIPIFTRGALYGFLGFDEIEQRREWKSADIGFLRSTVQILDRALERAQAQQALQRRNLELAALNAVTQALSASLDLHDILVEALSRTVHALGVAGGLIALGDGQTEELTLFSYTGLPQSLIRRLQTFGMPSVLCNLVYRERRPLVQESLHENASADWCGMLEVGLQSYVGIPIIHKKHVLGVLCIFDNTPYSISESDRDVLSAIGQQIGVAVENARLFEETQQRVRELQLLHDVSLATAAGLHLEEILQAAVTVLAAKFEGPRVGIELLDRDSGVLWAKASVGYAEEVYEMPIPLGSGITGWVAQHGEPVLVPDVRLDPRYIEIDSDTRSELCIPLIIGSEVIGVLNVESSRIDAFTDDDVQLLSTLASNLAVLTERARLFEEVEAARFELQQRAGALEEANARLQELDRLKSQFLASMSHELRTPLNSIIGFSEILIDGLVGAMSPEQKDCVRDIHSSGEHLLALINDVLDLSKIEAGRMTLEPTTFDVAGLLLEVKKTVMPLIEKKSQVLTVEQAEDLPPLTADHIRIRQVLINLLSNASKFTPTEGQIKLSCRLAGPAAILFSVTDTGIGIKPEDQGLIFEEFRQADDVVAQEITGTGLGLSISKRLVEMHGGRIWVESEYKRGATFSFLLPLASPATAESKAPGAATLFSDSKTVLIVEDDRQFSDLLTFYLRREGYIPIQCYNGVGVVKQARELKPALITLDIMLPEQDGWQVLQALKLDPQTKDIPVLVISVLDNSELALSLGAVDYLVKPVRREDLRALLRRLAPLEPSTQEFRVLVVDDDPDIVYLVQEILSSENYALFAAYGGQKALTLARSKRPSVILLDLMMPGMSGFEVLEKLRADAETADIPVIVLTGRDVTDEERKFLDDQIQGLVHKSAFTPRSLLKELRRLEKLALP